LLRSKLSNIKANLVEKNEMNILRENLAALIQFDTRFAAAVVDEPTPFRVDTVRQKLFKSSLSLMVETRYMCSGHHMGFISRYQQNFIVMQAGPSHINIYREEYSTEDPYQTLPLQMQMTCAIEFNSFLIIGGSNGSIGTVNVFKPIYNEEGADIQFK